MERFFFSSFFGGNFEGLKNGPKFLGFILQGFEMPGYPPVFFFLKTPQNRVFSRFTARSEEVVGTSKPRVLEVWGREKPNTLYIRE